MDFYRKFPPEFYQRDYFINGTYYRAFVTDDLEKRQKILTEYLDSIYEGFRRFYETKCPHKSYYEQSLNFCPVETKSINKCKFNAHGIFDCPLEGKKGFNYPIKTKKDFRDRILSPKTTLFLVVDLDNHDFVLFFLGKYLGKRRTNSFYDVWHGDFTIEASNLFKNDKYRQKNVSFYTFRDLVKKVWKIYKKKYFLHGYQPYATGRVLWSEIAGMYFIHIDRVHGFPLLMFNRWIPVWEPMGQDGGLGTWTSQSIMIGKNKHRAKLTAKTIIPTHIEKKYPWYKYSKKLLNGYEGKVSDNYMMDPIEYEINDHDTSAQYRIISASDYENEIELYEQGFRRASTFPGRIFDEGKFRSILVMEKITKYSSFPTKIPERNKFISNIPSWPPHLHQKTWEYISNFNNIESYPVSIQKYFLGENTLRINLESYLFCLNLNK